MDQFKGQTAGTVKAMLFQVAIVIGFTVIIYTLFHSLLVSQIGRITQNGFWVFFWSFALALVLWSRFFFKTGMFQAHFIKVKPGYICVLKKGTAGPERRIKDGLHGKSSSEFVSVAVKEETKVQAPAQPQAAPQPGTPPVIPVSPFTLQRPEYIQAKVEEATIALGPKADPAKSAAKWSLIGIPIAAIVITMIFMRVNPSRPDETKWTILEAEAVGLTNAPTAHSAAPVKKENVEKVIITDQGWREICVNGRPFTAKCNPPVPRVVMINGRRIVSLEPNDDPVFTERVHTLRYIVRSGYGDSCLTVKYN